MNDTIQNVEELRSILKNTYSDAVCSEMQLSLSAALQDPASQPLLEFAIDYDNFIYPQEKNKFASFPLYRIVKWLEILEKQEDTLEDNLLKLRMDEACTADRTKIDELLMRYHAIYHDYTYVKSDSRITKEDWEYLSTLQTWYNRTLSLYCAWYEAYHQEKSKYTDNVCEKLSNCGILIDSLGVCQQIIKLHNRFITAIYQYFSNKYHVTLGFPPSFSAWNSFCLQDDTMAIAQLDCRHYVRKILSILNGLTFLEKEVLEIKERIQQSAGTDSTFPITVAGDTVKCKTSMSFSTPYYGNQQTVESHYHDGKKIRPFLEALALSAFADSSRKIEGLDKLYAAKITLTTEEIRIGLASKNVPFLKGIKCYKGGRVDIAFASHQAALAFAENWCGYRQEFYKEA